MEYFSDLPVYLFNVLWKNYSLRSLINMQPEYYICFMEINKRYKKEMKIQKLEVKIPNWKSKKQLQK